MSRSHNSRKGSRRAGFQQHMPSKIYRECWDYWWWEGAPRSPRNKKDRTVGRRNRARSKAKLRREIDGEL